jgi:hypothetical protein
MTAEITSTNPVVRAILEGTAPRPAQLAASRGSLPLPQTDILEILVGLYNGTDAELKENARVTLSSQDAGSMEESVRSGEVAGSVLAYFIDRDDIPAALHESIISSARTPPAAIVRYATRTQNGSLLELISFNQQLLIQNPAILDAIIGNKSATSSRRNEEHSRSRVSFVHAGMTRPLSSWNRLSSPAISTARD